MNDRLTVLNGLIRESFLEDLNKREKEHPLTIDEYDSLIGILMAEKDKCVIADERYLVLSVALDWAISKRKGKILDALGVG